MDNFLPEFHQSFIERFSELFKLYKEVKDIVFLAEYENKEQKYIISSVNELRNTLDHIMRSFDSPESLEKNFDKAKGHLYRAGYDGYEIIVVSKLAEIKEIKEQFKLEAIITAYPEYFTKDIPIIQRAKNQLVIARANKKIDNGLDKEVEKKHYDQFENIATELIKTVDNLRLHIDGISEVHQNLVKKERKNKLIIAVLAPLIIGLVVGILILFIEYIFFTP
ncbi:MAG: hypothetical protein AB2L24_13370 [Mangrovibacterium sp.]